MKACPTLGMWGIAAAAWGATITVDALNWPVHIWICSLTVAGMSTLSAFQCTFVTRWRRESQALTRAVITRPVNRDTWPVAPPMRTPPRDSVPLAPVCDLRRRNGHRASR